jgi:hypothetical protein
VNQFRFKTTLGDIPEEFSLSFEEVALLERG